MRSSDILRLLYFLFFIFATFSSEGEKEIDFPDR